MSAKSLRAAASALRTSSERDENEELEDLVGGSQKAFRLMKIWQGCANLGTSMDRLMEPERYQQDIAFVSQAKKEGFSPEAIRFYVTKIQGGSWPPKVKKVGPAYRRPFGG